MLARFLDWGFWAGWAMVIIASEWWIAALRRARGATRAPVVANLASARYCKAAEPTAATARLSSWRYPSWSGAHA